MQNVEMLSAALGLLGSLLLATKSRYAGLAFVAWFVSNIGWLIFGARNDHWFFFAQQIGFTVTSVLGIWNWLVRPKPSPFVPMQEQEQRIHAAIKCALETDFVVLEHTPRVLQTSAPVTYDCLRHILLMGVEVGRELEARS